MLLFQLISSQNHRIAEVGKDFKRSLSQTPLQKLVPYNRLPGLVSRQALNISIQEDSRTSLGNQFQHSITIIVKKLLCIVWNIQVLVTSEITPRSIRIWQYSLVTCTFKSIKIKSLSFSRFMYSIYSRFGKNNPLYLCLTVMYDRLNCCMVQATINLIYLLIVRHCQVYHGDKFMK